ncbi:MAG: mechanosensitive ion channel family protein [Candidatus Pacearchaeota archaeon]
MVMESYIQNDYLRAIILSAIILLFIKIFVSIFLKTISFLTRKTKNEFDDMLLNKSSTPLIIIVFLLSSAIPLRELPFSENLHLVINKIIFSLVILTSGYLAYILLGIIISNGWKKFARKTKTKIDENLASLIQHSLRISMIIIAILFILDLWEFEIGPLLAGLGIAGLAVALALQPTLSNIFSGISMILDKSLRTGDVVYLDIDTKGTVEKIGFRSTKIKTFDNELIIVPNNKLAESKIQNIALPEPKSRVVIPFGVAYGSDIEKVKNIVIKEIKSVSHFINDPEPLVRFTEMGNSSLNFKAYFYVDSYENRFSAIDEANTKIYNALNKNKISIPFPQLEVHMKKD